MADSLGHELYDTAVKRWLIGSDPEVKANAEARLELTRAMVSQVKSENMESVVELQLKNFDRINSMLEAELSKSQDGDGVVVAALRKMIDSYAVRMQKVAEAT